MMAAGLLRHCFWGSYRAQIILKFGTAEHAQAALAELPGWTVSDKNSAALSWFGADPELAATIDRLVSFGADRHAIDSVDHSIDYGDPFTVDVPRPLDAQQIGLDLDEAQP
jgi:hypothetical protein